MILTSVLFDYTGTYRQMIEDIRNGSFGKVYTLGVENGGVRLLDLPDDVAQDVKDEVERVRQEIVAGRITVSAVADAGELRRRVEELFPS